MATTSDVVFRRKSDHSGLVSILRQDPYQITAERCRRSLFYFMKTFWDCVSPDDPQYNWHIPYLCEEVEKVIRRAAAGLPKLYDLIINIPPGMTKTTLVSIMAPPWAWANWPWMRFITSSYAQKLALESADYSRELVRSEKFRQVFPDYDIKADKEALGNFRIVVKDAEGRPQVGGNRFSASVGSALTGFHGHVLMIDDPINPMEAVSELKLQTANNWMSQTLSTRKTNKSVTPTILIMQRLHENDPTGNWFKKKKDNIRHICLPGEIRNYRKQLSPPEVAEFYEDDLLDPGRMGWGVLEEMEADLGQYGYSGQIGQNPAPPGGGMFKVDRFQIEDHIPNSRISKRVRYWDKAATKDSGNVLVTGKGARTAGVKMYLLDSGKFVVANAKAGRWETDEREDIIRQTAEADGREVPVILEREPGSGGKDSANASIKNLAGFVADDDRPTGDKVYRADPWSVQVNRGNVILLNGPWVEDFIREHEYFPFGAVKDLVDASSGAFKYLTDKRKRAGTW